MVKSVSSYCVHQSRLLSNPVTIITLPLADPSVMVTSTMTSLDALLLSIRPIDNGVMFSSIEYCDWLNDNTDPVDQLITYIKHNY